MDLLVKYKVKILLPDQKVHTEFKRMIKYRK